MIYVLAREESLAQRAARRFAWGQKDEGYTYLTSLQEVRRLPKGAEVVKVNDWDANSAYGSYDRVQQQLMLTGPKVVRTVQL